MSLIRAVIEELFEDLNIKTKADFKTRTSWGVVYQYVYENHRDAWDSVKTPKNSIRYYGQKLMSGYKIGRKDILMAEYGYDEEYIRQHWMDRVVMAEILERV